MDLNALTLLVDILDAGNLSKAAQRLKMSRANVSYRLNQLEKSIGLPLLGPPPPRGAPPKTPRPTKTPPPGRPGRGIARKQAAALESAARQPALTSRSTVRRLRRSSSS